MAPIPGRAWSETMDLLVINPNSTVAMTEAMVDVARRSAPGFSIEGWTSHDGPASIQGRADGERATKPLLTLVDQVKGSGAHGVIIGCFDDTALEEAAARLTVPVIGIGQAAFHYCAMRNWRFSVVTTLQVSVPVIEGNLRTYGLWDHVGRVRASDVPVLTLDASPELSTEPILRETLAAASEDRVDAVVLGCAGMGRVTPAIRGAAPLPIIDPVEAAATCMAWMIAQSDALALSA
ncbi:MAG: aspartate/glutamate racemase family protein [Pseudomonadota bacterium]